MVNGHGKGVEILLGAGANPKVGLFPVLNLGSLLSPDGFRLDLVLGHQAVDAAGETPLQIAERRAQCGAKVFAPPIRFPTVINSSGAERDKPPTVPWQPLPEEVSPLSPNCGVVLPQRCRALGIESNPPCFEVTHRQFCPGPRRCKSLGVRRNRCAFGRIRQDNQGRQDKALQRCIMTQRP